MLWNNKCIFKDMQYNLRKKTHSLNSFLRLFTLHISGKHFLKVIYFEIKETLNEVAFCSNLIA